MSSRLVDDVAIPLPVAGHPALDFCNTRAGWNSTRPKEYLRSPTVLVIWCREFGLITAADADRLIAQGRREPARAQACLERAIAVREALYPISLGRGTPIQWSLVAAEAAAARSHTRLVPRRAGATVPAGSDPTRIAVPGVSSPVRSAPDTGLFGSERHEPGYADWQPEWSGLETAVLAVAGTAADLLTSRLAGSVRACPGADCGWLFADPRGRRRWCSMAVCGNRAKARKHRGGGALS